MRSTIPAAMAIAFGLSSNASAALTTTGTFSRWFGDVRDPSVWEVYVNDMAVANNLPDVNNVPQGELVFTSPQPASVEFKSRQVGLYISSATLANGGSGSAPGRLLVSANGRCRKNGNQRSVGRSRRTSGHPASPTKSTMGRAPTLLAANKFPA